MASVRRQRDLQIFWVVVIGLGFWAAIWQHEIVSKYWDKFIKLFTPYLK